MLSLLAMLIGKILKFHNFIKVVRSSLFIDVLLNKVVKTAFENLEGLIGMDIRFARVIDGHERVLVDGATKVGVVGKKRGLLDDSFVL